MRLGALLVRDGLHERPFGHTLHSLRGMWYYEYSHSAKARAVYTVTVTLLLSLIFLEAPAAGAPPLLPSSITLSVESMCLVVIATDIYAQFVYLGGTVARVRRRHWLLSRTVCWVLVTGDLVFAIAVPGFPRYTRSLRMYLLLSRLRNLRNSLSIAARTIPSTAIVGGILLFTLLLFTLLGWLLFDPHNPPWDTIATNATASGLCSSFTHVCNGYFDNFGWAFYHMWFLLPGLNFPDVMLPYVRRNEWSSLFFIAYIVIAQMFLWRLLITAAFSAYREELTKRVLVRERRSIVAFHWAFRVLTGVSRGDGGKARSGAGKDASGTLGGPASPARAALLDWPTWRDLARSLRPGLPLGFIRVIYIAAANPSSGAVGEHMFMDMCRLLDADVALAMQDFLADPRAGAGGETLEGVGNVQAKARDKACALVSRRLTRCYAKFRTASQRVVHHRVFHRLFDLLAFGSVTRLVLVRIHYVPSPSTCILHFSPTCSMDVVGYCIVALFAIEQILKVAGMGWKEYWAWWTNRLDLLVSVVSILASITISIAAASDNGKSRSNPFLT